MAIRSLIAVEVLKMEELPFLQGPLPDAVSVMAALPLVLLPFRY